MSDTRAGEAAEAGEETRLILLPVDLDDASIAAVKFAAKNVLRKGA